MRSVRAATEKSPPFSTSRGMKAKQLPPFARGGRGGMRLLWTGCLSLFLASPLYAQQPPSPQPTPLPETTVTGERAAGTSGNPFPTQPLTPDIGVTPTRTEAPLSQFGGSVTVIRGEQWRQSQQNYV